MSDAQVLASKIHKLNELARLHCGKFSTVSYRASSGTFSVQRNGTTLAEGTYDQVVSSITGGDVK